jgi:predicted O-methyltransferase YrrM
MFESISTSMLTRMRELEAIDLRDRTDGTPHAKRLRQISPDTGKLLALLVASAPAGRCIEIGTSAGYSTLWLALACRATSGSAGGVNRRLTTFDIDAAKVEIARATFAAAGVSDVIEQVHGDALAHLPDCDDIAFCFLDAEKDLYQPAYDLIVPRMVPGGILVADNAISHEAQLRPMLDFALRDDRMDSVLVPIGQGDLICRKK